jgi:hypothetical protein
MIIPWGEALAVFIGTLPLLVVGLWQMNCLNKLIYLTSHISIYTGRIDSAVSTAPHSDIEHES